MKTFEKVGQLFRDIESAVRVANVLDKAYAEGTGNPDWHNPFGIDNPQLVAMNLAGLYAADTAANIIAAGRRELDEEGKVSAEAYVEALEDLECGDLSALERFIAKNCANATWRAGQPFRDISTNPLSRITRDINMQFNLLPPDEEDKDLIQTCRGAQLILDAINR